MKHLLVATTASLLLAACAGGGLATTESSLQHHRWALASVNGEPVDAGIGSELAIGEHMAISGLAGCNRFFGSAKLEQGRLRADPLASTKMACLSDSIQQVETAVLATLTQGAEVRHEGRQLTLTGGDYVLGYRLADED
ncbi:heat-shock protein HslJ [Zobellella denitrificans]|uniref:Heat-shock protein HslJ n=1 Tax=Zobellella denitrificans TaxID=347534 RepID=A0A291HT17_9GAMM|nr:META domain-containing protein [Zobellella denitrificans]ATG75310.1 heat-shock protein HslJ [Zobellella denitrificans]